MGDDAGRRRAGATSPKRRIAPVALWAILISTLPVGGGAAGAGSSDELTAAIRADVDWLAADARLGRGPDTASLSEVGAWLEERFAAAGVPPAASRYRQPFAWEEAALPAFNVVGRIEGREPSLAPVVVGAHYDHLGLGGWSSLAPGREAPHNGADDNASGVAALLALGRLLAAVEPPRRTVLLAAFSGEEAGRLGSAAFLGGLVAPPIAMLNLDMIGRLRSGRLYAAGLDSDRRWRELLATACQRAGLECLEAGEQAPGPSDEEPFLAAGVPALRLTTGVHDDYHRPEDDASEVDVSGILRITRLARELTAAWAEIGDVAAEPRGRPGAGARR